MQITERITLSPKFLTKDIEKYIRDEFVKKVSDKCTKDAGYILGIAEMVSYRQCMTSKGLTFLVTCNVINFLPKVDDIYDGKIVQIFPHGMIISVRDVFNVFVASNTKEMSKFKYDMNKETYLSENISLSVGSLVDIKISTIKFADGSFKSYGRLVV